MCSRCDKNLKICGKCNVPCLIIITKIENNSTSNKSQNIWLLILPLTVERVVFANTHTFPYGGVRSMSCAPTYKGAHTLRQANTE